MRPFEQNRPDFINLRHATRKGRQNSGLEVPTFIRRLRRPKYHDVEVAHVLLRGRRADPRCCTHEQTKPSQTIQQTESQVPNRSSNNENLC